MAKGAKTSAAKARKTKAVAKTAAKTPAKTPAKSTVKSASAQAAVKAAPAAKSGAAVSAKGTAAAKTVKPAGKTSAAKPPKGGAVLQAPPSTFETKAQAKLPKTAKTDTRGPGVTPIAMPIPISKTDVGPSLLSNAPAAKAPEKTDRPEKKAKANEPKAEKKSKKASKSLAIALDKLADLGAQWNSLYERSKDLEAVPYKMSNSYAPRTAIMHKVLGWGYVLSSQNDRLEVLFKDGIKILISNYKG